MTNGIELANCDGQLTQIIIAYHFFTLQWLAQSLAKNTLPRVARQEIIPTLPKLFLTTSNHRLWIAKAPYNEKYQTNCMKLIRAFIKVLESQKKHYRLEITCLQIKLMDFTNHSDTEDFDYVAGAEPFIQDTKFAQFKDTHGSGILDLKQAKMTTIIPLTCAVPTDDSLRPVNDTWAPSPSKATNFESARSILASFSLSTVSALSSQQIALLDSVTLFCKDNLGPELVPFLGQLYELFKRHNQLKRVRNVSNLLFKLGKKINDTELLNLAIGYELFIFQRQQSERDFELLVGKLRMVDQYTPYMMRTLLQACEICKKIDTPTLSLINKVLSNNYALSGCLNEVDEQFRFQLVMDICRGMNNQKEEKSDICNAIVNGVRFSNDQYTLQLQLAYYDIGGIEHLNLKEPATCDLIASTGLAMAKMNLNAWNENGLTRIYGNLAHWARDVSQVDEFEKSIVERGILLLKYNGMNRKAMEIAETVLKGPIVDDYFRIFLHFQLCCISARLQDHSVCKKSIAQLQSLIGETKHLRFEDVMNYKIESIKLLAMEDYETARTKFKSFTSVLKSRPEFDLNQSKSLSIWEKLKNFLILAKSQLLAAQINVDDLACSHSCLQKALRILYLILKKCPTDSKISSANEIMWETKTLLLEVFNLIVGSLADLGLSKTIPVYLVQWNKLNESVEAPLVNQINRYKIRIYGILSKSENFTKSTQENCELVQADPTVQWHKSVLQLLLHQEQVELHKSDSHLFAVRENPFLRYATQHEEIHHFQDSLARCLSRLNNFKAVGSFSGGVQLFPSITRAKLCLDDNAMEVYLDLGKIKDSLLGQVHRLEFAIVEQKRLYYTLLQCVHLISSISAYNGQDLLFQMYFMQDWIKAKPLVDERRLTLMDEKKLIPEVSQPKRLSHSQQLSQFKSDLLFLPANWSVFTIDICEVTGDLLLSKLQSGQLPTFVRLSLTRFKERESIKTLTFDEMKKEFERIFQANRESTLYSTTSLVKTIQDRKKWWKTRFTLDYELQELLQHVEKFWFGGFQGIFGSLASSFNEFKLDLTRILRTHISDSIERTITLNDVVFESFYGLRRYDRACVDDLLSFLMDLLSFHSNVDNASINFEKIHESIQDLLDKYQKRDQFGHVVLIPSARCSFFPWESLQFLRGKSVTRMPSVSMLTEVLKKNPSRVNSSEVYYLINPGGDLKTSQQRFQPLINKHKSWKGLAGVKPDENKIVDDILASKLFVYIGHGGCDQYVKSRTLFQATEHRDLPPCLLIGCSSGSLQDHGQFEPSGGIFSWINCGSPLVLANLWDVTDKDIDTFTNSTFKYWGLHHDTKEKVDIAEAVRMSRDVCILKYLNGSAPVIYGLPLMTS
ncbi:ESP1 [Candida theae]|uniref:separase n=1 Tax=Candida theae TaxID=1198502 RepID=A0AAD5BH54_9ASCO|nr:ESP1 [Candida theae]KAI5962792.1 ESP1 [Candida theae]